MALPWKVAWITGASTGIGAAVALQMAEQGMKVAASARHLPSLPQHPNIFHFPLDVTDNAAIAVCVENIENQLGSIDLGLFAAGAYRAFNPEDFDMATFRRINEVNYLGPIQCLNALLPRFKVRKAGRVAFVASVAGYQGLPKAAYYGPTKAALINLAEALWMELRPFGIDVSVVNPGFVETPMTAGNDFPMPFLMNPEKAAALTIKGLKAGRFEIAYPLPFVLILKLLQKLPVGLKLRLLQRMTA